MCAVRQHVVTCRYDLAAPKHHASVDCGLFMIGYAICTPAISFHQAEMLAVRRELNQQLVSLGGSPCQVISLPCHDHMHISQLIAMDLCCRYHNYC